MPRTLFLLKVLLVCVHGLTKDEWRDDFRSWQEAHDRRYKSALEEEQRFGYYRQNAEIVAAYNRKFNPDTTFALNQFADLSFYEFRDKILMPHRKPSTFPEHRYLESPEFSEPMPDTFDWAGKGVITAVKDQGAAGSCWAFSAIGNMEGQWAMAGHTLTNFSTEQIVDCDGMEDISNAKADCGVFGGWPYLAFDYVRKVGGLQRDSDYPYCAGGGGKPGTCFTCPPPGYNWTLCGPPTPYCMMNESCFAKLNVSKFVPGFTVSSWKVVSPNESDIAYYLMKLGPLSIALNAQLLQFYEGGVFDPPDFLCNPHNLDHAVLLVGWGVHDGILGKTPYWNVKNSWGPKWGEKGYFRIKRGSGKCGVNTQVTTALLG